MLCRRAHLRQHAGRYPNSFNRSSSHVSVWMLNRRRDALLTSVMARAAGQPQPRVHVPKASLRRRAPWRPGHCQSSGSCSPKKASMAGRSFPDRLAGALPSAAHSSRRCGGPARRSRCRPARRSRDPRRSSFSLVVMPMAPSRPHLRPAERSTATPIWGPDLSGCSTQPPAGKICVIPSGPRRWRRRSNTMARAGRPIECEDVRHVSRSSVRL
jgi:hypothetical protein